MNIDKHFFEHKRVLIFGFGTNGGGLGTAQFLLTTGAQKIIITDQKEQGELQASISQLPKDARLEWHLGRHPESVFLEADIIIKNPSIPWDHPLLLSAQKNGALVVMDSTIFMALCPVPIIGITGSKGKTTTASVLVHILTTAGHHVVPVGVNQVGVLSELSKVQEKSVVVFELSSWRLSGLAIILKSPFISIITNLYEDHLNYYGSMESYAQDKKIITEFQQAGDVLIVGHNQEWTPYFTSKSKAAIQEFGTTSDLACWQDERALYLMTDEGPQEILQKEKTHFTGEYIFENFLAASLAALSYGVSISVIIEALKTFVGVPNRFELVREYKNVRYINDTTATNPTAAYASFQSTPSPVILLAGGSDKGLSSTPLELAIGQAKWSILFAGTGTDILLPALKKAGYTNFEVVKSMEEAVKAAFARAVTGDTVLLAPGAASFGMFQNEFERGEQFVKQVESL